jgi:hypothetical protein
MTVMKRFALPAAVLAVGLPALAQDAARDWDLHQDTATRSTLAYTTFDSGLSLAFRCADGSFAAVLAGLPPERQARRTLRLGFRGDPVHDTRWTTTTDRSVVVADYPAALAREFRQGGELKVTVPGGAGNGRDLSYIVPLPTSNAAIDQVLTECGRPLVDPRDIELEAVAEGGLTAGFEWERAPRPRFPRSRYASGFAVTTCMSRPDGALADCVIESEHPQDGGFGEAALKAAERARVRVSGDRDAAVPPRKIGFYTAFVAG